MFAGLRLADVSVAQQSSGSVLWIAGDDFIEKRSTIDGASLLNIPFTGEVHSVAVDGVNSKVWVFSGNNLLAYNFDGVLLSTTPAPIPSPDPGDDHESDDDYDDDDDDFITDDVEIGVNSNSDSLWVAMGYNLYCISTAGQFGDGVALDGDVESVSVNKSASIAWVATEENISAYSSACALIASIDVTDDDIESIYYDNDSSLLWVASENSVRAYSSSDTLSFELAIVDAEDITSAGVGVWLSVDNKIVRLSNSGATLLNIDLGAEVEAIAGDSDSSVWVALTNTIVHVGADGTILATINTTTEIEDLIISGTSTRAPPTISITAPPDGSFLNMSTPDLVINYQHTGAGIDTTSIAFTLNGNPLSVTCQALPATATCSPVNALPEGVNNISVTVADNDGLVSDPATASFSIDTVAPVITLTTPVDGDANQYAERYYRRWYQRAGWAYPGG